MGNLANKVEHRVEHRADHSVDPSVRRVRRSGWVGAAALSGLLWFGAAWGHAHPESVATHTQSGAGTQELPPIRVPFRGQAGDRTLLRWSAHHRLESTQYTVQRGEGEPSIGTLLPKLESKEERTLQDWVQSVDAERPLRVRRRVQKATLWGKLDFRTEGFEPLEARLESPFTQEGTTVQFTYVPTEGQYGRYYDRNASGERRLKHLRYDLDYQAWRPRGTVGDTWVIPVEALRPMLAPGGEMDYTTQDRTKRVLTRSMRLGFGGSWETLLGSELRDANGKPYLQGAIQVQFEREASSPVGPEAHLTFTYEVRNRVDQTRLAQIGRDRNEQLDGTRIEHAWVDLQSTGQGRLVWDVQSGRVKGLRLDGQVAMQLDLSWQGGDEVSTRELTEYRGNYDVDAFLSKAPEAEEPEPWTVRPGPMPEATPPGGEDPK